MIEAVVESGAEEPQLLSCVADRSVTFAYFLNEKFPFLLQLHLAKILVVGKFLARCGLGGGNGNILLAGCFCRGIANLDVFGAESACAGEAECALDDVFQFSNIARPVVFLQLE